MPRALTRVVHNGVTAAEFEPVETARDAADLVFVGELRILKGVDVLIEAIAELARDGRTVTANIVGEGPDRAAFEAEVAAQNLAQSVRFLGAMPARAAFPRGRILVVPSRAESLPYIVLEAAAAGVPLIATRVGGIPEILGPDADDLVAPADVAALARAIGAALRDPKAQRDATIRLQARIRSAFSADAMTEGVLAAYGGALELRDG
jgi:glycosyltransferase involved in cell wall biosynthesis